MKLGWYSELEPVERKTFWACFAGFGLDPMDTTTYALVIPAMIATIGLTRPEAGYLATAALAARRSEAGERASWRTGSGACASCR